MLRIAITALIIGVSATGVAAQPWQRAYELALRDITTRVQGRTGSGAQSCGNLFLRPGESPQHTAARVEEAIGCAQRAASSGAPVWFVVGGHGLDSWIAEGLLAAPYGAIEHYTYDSDPGGGGGVSDRARFDSGHCFGAHVYQYQSGGFAIECLNDSWRLVVHAAVLGLCAATVALGAVLARRSWRKTAGVVLIHGAGSIAAGMGTLARLGGLRADLALPAAACLLLMVGFLVRLWCRPASLAA